MARRRKAVGFLQNAWSPRYAGGTWPRPFWLFALSRSRSGQRLNAFRAPGVELYWENTTPVVGSTAASVVPPDPEHVRAVLAEQAPGYVVTFGKQADRAVTPLLGGRPCLVLPHPAYRYLQNALYHAAGERLAAGFEGVFVYVQNRGGFEVVERRLS